MIVIFFQILQVRGDGQHGKIVGKIHMIVKLVYGLKLKKKNG